MSKYVVRYKVFGKPERAGPYAAHEILAHAEDIGSFMGITEVKIEPACEECHGEGLVPTTDYVEGYAVPSGEPCPRCTKGEPDA